MYVSQNYTKFMLKHTQKNNLCGISVLLNVMVDLAEPLSGICLDVENNQ